jgi:acyl-CoA synthetase (AMP-forming)/AMP-acid ligase II
VEVRVAADGELRFRGPQLFLGYVDAALDADAFDSDGFFRTGDLGEVDEHGYVHITGRIKDIIIRNAENISAVEVENVLHEHRSIQDVAVVGVPDPKTGEHAVAVIVLAPGAAPLTLQEIGEHCTARGLARQKTPEQLDFVDVLPRNSMGKILKHELRARLVG